MTRLSQAAAEGRLQAEELADRLAAALSARTYGELDALLSDLPIRVADERRRLIDVFPPRAITRAAALLLALVTLAGALGLGIHRSSAAAPNQPSPPLISHGGGH